MGKGLTEKQEGFCLSIIKGKSASDAYRENYDCGSMKQATINRNAKALMDNNKIATRLDELRKPVRDAACLTMESHLRRLNELSIAAEKEEQFSAAITAETNRGKAAGLYVERIAGADGGPIQEEVKVTFVKAKPKDD